MGGIALPAKVLGGGTAAVGESDRRGTGTRRRSVPRLAAEPRAFDGDRQGRGRFLSGASPTRHRVVFDRLPSRGGAGDAPLSHGRGTAVPGGRRIAGCPRRKPAGRSPAFLSLLRLVPPGRNQRRRQILARRRPKRGF